MHALPLLLLLLVAVLAGIAAGSDNSWQTPPSCFTYQSGFSDEHSYEPNNKNATASFKMQWLIDGDYINVRLAVTSVSRKLKPSWIGFGISEAGHMLGSDIVTVTYDFNQGAMVDDRWVPWSAYDENNAGVNASFYPRLDTYNDWSLLCVRSTGTFLSVIVRRLLDTQDGQDRAIANGTIPTIWAWGTTPGVAYHIDRGSDYVTFQGDPTSQSFNCSASPDCDDSLGPNDDGKVPLSFGVKCDLSSIASSFSTALYFRLSSVSGITVGQTVTQTAGLTGCVSSATRVLLISGSTGVVLSSSSGCQPGKTYSLRFGSSSSSVSAFSAIYFIAASASDLAAVSTDQTVTGPACIGSSKVTVTAADMANRALYLSATELATYYTSGTPCSIGTSLQLTFSPAIPVSTLGFTAHAYFVAQQTSSSVISVGQKVTMTGTNCLGSSPPSVAYFDGTRTVVLSVPTTCAAAGSTVTLSFSGGGPQNLAFKSFQLFVYGTASVFTSSGAFQMVGNPQLVSGPDCSKLNGKTAVVTSFLPDASLVMLNSTRTSTCTNGQTYQLTFTDAFSSRSPFNPLCPGATSTKAGSNPGGYPVQSLATQYITQVIDLNDAAFNLSLASGDRHIIAVEPAYQSSAVHHVLVHSCSVPADLGGFFTKKVSDMVGLYSLSYGGAWPGQAQHAADPKSEQGSSPLGQSYCTQLVFGNARGAGPVILPQEAGYRVGLGAGVSRYLVLEAHINNPNDAVTGVVVGDLVKLYFASRLRPNDAGTLIVGDPALSQEGKALPTGVVTSQYNYACTPTCTQILGAGGGSGTPATAANNKVPTINIFSSFLHMHAWGRQAWSTKVEYNYTAQPAKYRKKFGSSSNRFLNLATPSLEGGKGDPTAYPEISRTLLDKREFWNAGFQTSGPTDFTLSAGDAIYTHCVYDTTKADPMDPPVWGPASDDEMCMHFLFYWPNAGMQYCGVSLPDLDKDGLASDGSPGPFTRCGGPSMDISSYVSGYYGGGSKQCPSSSPTPCPGLGSGFNSDQLSEAKAAHLTDGITVYPLAQFGVASSIPTEPFVVLASLTFSISGVPISVANTDSFKQGVKIAVANATEPSLDVAQIGSVAVSALSAAMQERRGLLSSVGVTVGINGPASASSLVVSQLQSLTADSLTTALAFALPAYSGLAATGLSFSQLAPTSSPTLKPVVANNNTAFIIGIVLGVFGSFMISLGVYLHSKRSAESSPAKVYASS